ncbi:MAG: polyprenyl synthetase family protein [Candidatus Symbiothrix sp.]|jgi:octaprenyl-diphosphate synthase|nr:polyprenyl synthetase family protein [Candidatus Symbiothrix sp.]
MELQLITLSIQSRLDEFERLFAETLQAPGMDFQPLLNFVSAKKGKRVRPQVLLLAAQLCGTPNRKSLEYALILELLHTATLIHDDVVDDTKERRGQPSVMAKYGNRAAVLLGDYILSQAITKGVSIKNLKILQILASLAQYLSEGELSQLISTSGRLIDEQCYFEIIWKKTAVFLASCTEMGAISVDADTETTEILRKIGKNLGLCFQLRDDIFDYYEQGEIGKPTGNDIREGKITLPLIYALRTAPKEEADEMQALIQKQDFSSENIRKLLSFAKVYHGIEYTQAKMQEIKGETIRLLSHFPASESKQAMIMLMDYIIERRK